MSVKRTAILGSSTFQGRELLGRLGDDRDLLGRVALAEAAADESIATPVAGEWMVSTPLMDEALEGADLVLCCTRLGAEAAGVVRAVSGSAVVIDLAGSLRGRAFDARAGATLASLGPGIHASPKASSLVVAALSRAALRAGASGRPAAVILEPASEMGREAVDELSSQALALLTFKPMPTEVFGRQAVHDVLSPGPGGGELEDLLRREVAELGGGDVAILVLRPGLFHGMGLAMHAAVPPKAWLQALRAEPRLQLALDEEGGISPAGAVAAESALVGRVSGDGGAGAWAWAAADTLAHGSVGNVLDLLRGK